MRRDSMLQNFAAVTLFCGIEMCLPVSGLFGQATPQVPPAITASPVAPLPLTAPFQGSPVTLPPSPTLPLSLNLGVWLGFPTTYISVNGSQERMGISTGLNANTVSPAAAARLGIPEGKTKVRVDILDHAIEAPETALKSLQMGLLKLENVPVAQIDVVSLLSRAPHPDAPTGWLGTPFLAAFQVTLDMSRKVCTLEKPLAKMPAGALVVPMTLREGRIFVSVSLPKSKPFLAMIDTGTVLTLIPASVGVKLKLPALEVVKLGNAGKEVQATLIQVPAVTVGKAECKALRVAYLSADVSPSFGRETAVLGLDFLSRFKVVFSFASKKVAFMPPVVPDASGAAPDTPAPRPQGGKKERP